MVCFRGLSFQGQRILGLRFQGLSFRGLRLQSLRFQGLSFRGPRFQSLRFQGLSFGDNLEGAIRLCSNAYIYKLNLCNMRVK